MPKLKTTMTIWDVDHYTDEEKQAIIESYPEHERDARSKGIPQLGSGAIFPVSDESIKVDDFKIPDHWFFINGIDFGWDHPTAAAQLAIDNDTETIYVVKVYKKKQAVPYEHYMAIRGWGDEIPWAWPKDGLQTEKGSGQELQNAYREEGLFMLSEYATFPNGSVSVEAGVQQMLMLMKTDRFKVFASCGEFFEEKRTYHRKEGKIVAMFDDIISATRYAYIMRRFAVQKTLDIDQINEPMVSDETSNVSGY